MPTRAQVLTLAMQGVSYEVIGERLGVLPGMAYMVGTGLPADGSEVLAKEEAARRLGYVRGSTQHLANAGTALPKHQSQVEHWLVRMAAADEAMQRAAAARTAVPPPIEGSGETEDVVSVLGWDHQQVKFLLEVLQAIPGVKQGGCEAQQRQRRSVVDMITERLSPHEVAEEGHFWPAVRDALPDGPQVVERAKAQEQRGKDLLHDVGPMDGTEEAFDNLVEALVLALRTHVAFEDTVFLHLPEHIDEGQRAALGRAVLRAKENAPTRPHPHAPDEGMAARMAAAAAAPLDKARDALGHRPAEHRGTLGSEAPRPVSGVAAGSWSTEPPSSEAEPAEQTAAHRQAESRSAPPSAPPQDGSRRARRSGTGPDDGGGA